MSNTVTVEQYNKISFVVRGHTEIIKENLKQLGGRWNTNLKNGAGWLFNIKKHSESVREFLKKIKKDEVFDDDFSEVCSEACSEDMSEDEIVDDFDVCDYELVIFSLSTLFVFLAVFSY